MRSGIKIIIFSLFLFSAFVCTEGPPILPGLTKSEIVISTEPESSSVLINNKSTDLKTPSKVDELEPGFYKIDLTLNTYLDTAIYHVIKRNASDTIKIEMRENPVHWWKAYTKSNSPLPTNTIKTIEVDQYNNVWIGTSGGGLVKLKDNEWTIYNASNSPIPTNIVNAIAYDNLGVLWVCTDRGLVKFDGTNWQTYNQNNSNLPDDYLTAIAIDKNNVLWIGTVSGGLIKFDRVSFQTYDYNNSGLPINHTTSIAVDAFNVKWIGTWGEGLVSFDEKKWKVYNELKSGLISNFISSIEIDLNGTIWIGSGSSLSFGGLTKMAGQTITNFTVYNSQLPGTLSIVTDIMIDHAMNIWICTVGGGLAMFNGIRWRIYNIANSGIAIQSPLHIALDRFNNKWVAGGGVSFYIGQK